MFVWVAVGGRATLSGPILGAVGVSLCYSWLTGTFPGSWLYFLGFLFIAVVLFFPDGAAGAFLRLKARLQARKPGAPGDKPAEPGLAAAPEAAKTVLEGSRA